MRFYLCYFQRNTPFPYIMRFPLTWVINLWTCKWGKIMWVITTVPLIWTLFCTGTKMHLIRGLGVAGVNKNASSEIMSTGCEAYGGIFSSHRRYCFTSHELSYMILSKSRGEMGIQNPRWASLTKFSHSWARTKWIVA